jgi:Uma2 family endonuclease
MLAPAPSSAPQALLLLPLGLTLTPEQFALVCEANPDAVLELAADGRLVTMTTSCGDTGARNHSLSLALGLAAHASTLPLKLFGSSTGFRLGDGSVLSPDAAALRRKMAATTANGARLGWLLFPEQQAVEIWQAGADEVTPAVPRRLERATVVDGGDLLPGMVLDLEEVWQA